MTHRSLRLAAIAAAVAALPALYAQQAASMQPAPQPAQQPTQQQVAAAIDTMRLAVASARKQTVAQNMTFTDAEATKFWPVYDAYRAEIMKAQNGEWEVITAYAQNQAKMSDSLAQRLMGIWMNSKKQEEDVRAAYVPKFVAAIGWLKTARYYQIENKLDVMLGYARSLKIPLVQ